MSEAPEPSAVRWPTLLGVGLVAGASLMLELSLTRIFSVTLFYHFAFLVVSVALFGTGVAGVGLYLRGRLPSPERLPRALGLHAALFAAATALALWVALSVQIPPELGWAALPRLALLFGACALPFFWSGLCLSSAVSALPAQVSRVYGADLVGAAAGCLLTLPALDLLGGPGAVLLAGALATLGGVLFQARLRPRLVHGALALAAAGLVALQLGLGLFRVPSVKATDEGKVVFAGWNSFSRVTVSDTREPMLWMHIDSDAATAIFRGPLEQAARTASRFVEARLASLVHALRPGGHALIIGPGGGADVVGALSRGVGRVSGAELNPIIVDDIMRGRYADYSGRLYFRPDVDVQVAEGRSFVRSRDTRYDVIQATLVDTWAATSAGAFALSENNLYTLEAFGDFLGHLKPDGLLSMTRWLREPPREFARLVSLGVEALRLRGVSERGRHFFFAAGNRAGTFLMKASPFSPEELETLRATCRAEGLRVLYDPDGPVAPGDVLGNLARAPDPAALWEAYPLDIAPPTDDRPFFFYTTRPGDFLGAALSSQGETGVRVLGVLLVVVLSACLLFLLGPLALLGRAELRGQRGRRLLGLGYFVGLGVGFIGLEMAWMQHFILFLGHPTHALGVVLTVLLASSGLGARLTQRVAPGRAPRAALVSVGLLTALVALYGFGLGPLFRAAVGLPLGLRVLIAGALLVPAGLLMGRMMPLGLKAVAAAGPGLVPWAWGVNGAASVLGSALAVALAMNLGYRATQLLAVACYVLGSLCLWLANRKGVEAWKNSP
ncbi:MAG TPA: hypothetical protein PK668_12135 [Myxococcota bacterium]|nr:hypothetical protein [Myxococcota bacterium]HRY93783.1 hypothetical protein [Myxococcota bacterium]HSA22612.1 hypothetical protein [Myxococcota bacterium]